MYDGLGGNDASCFLLQTDRSFVYICESLPNESNVRCRKQQTAVYGQCAGSVTPSAQAIRSRMIPNAPLLYPPPNIRACYASACPLLRVEVCTLLCSVICCYVTPTSSGEANKLLTLKGSSFDVVQAVTHVQMMIQLVQLLPLFVVR